MGSLKDHLLGDCPSLPSYPTEPGYKENTTSRLAAAQVHDVDNVRCLVLQAIRDKPMTADEVATKIDIPIWTVRPRCSELRTMNQIRPHLRTDGKQMRRPNASGRAAIVWEVAPCQSI